MHLVDSHCHLQADRFEGDVDEVIARAREAGVERILVPGWDLDSSAAAIRLVQRHPWMQAAAGIHPHDAGRADAASWQGILRLVRDPRVVAIGETGLDYDRMFSPVEVQIDNLRRHLELGLELEKPVILHCRSVVGTTDAHDALIEELDRAGVRAARATSGTVDGKPPAIIHSFSGSEAFAREVIGRGLAISISGLAFRRGEEQTFEAVAASVPGARLLVETDSPFLSPPGAPRRRNEPAWVGVTAGRVAEARGEDPEGSGGQLVGAYDGIFGVLS